MTQAEPLPDVLTRIAEACGQGAALRLAQELGGTRINVPKRATPRCALARAVGIEIAEAVVRIYGGGDLLIPLGPVGWQRRARAAIVRATASGVSVAQTARQVGVHERTVRRVRKRLREDEVLPLLEMMERD